MGLRRSGYVPEPGSIHLSMYIHRCTSICTYILIVIDINQNVYIYICVYIHMHRLHVIEHVYICTDKDYSSGTGD